MGIVPTLAQDPPVLPPEEQPVAPPPETVVPTLAQDPAPAQSAPEQSAPVPSEAQDAPPPQGPVSGAINAVSNAVSNVVPDAIEDPLSGFVPDVAAVTTALGQGDIGGAVAPILDYANRPFEFGSSRQGERAASGQGQVPSPGEIADDPSAVFDVVPGFWNTSGPGAWAVGSDIDAWAERNPQAATDALAQGGGQAVYETWKASGGLQTTPAGVDSPIDDESYTGSVLDRAGQVASELGQFGGSVAGSARQGALAPFLKGMVTDIGNDPSFAGQVALGVATGGLSAAGGIAGRRGMVGLAKTLGRASTVGRRINEATDIALDPITNSIGATLSPAARGVRNLGGLLDYSTASREARAVNKLGETVGEYLNATPRTIPAAATPPTATPGARPPAPNGVAAISTPTLQPSPGGAPLLPTNTLYNPPTTRTAARALPAGRGSPYSRSMVTGAPSVLRATPSATPGPIPANALAVRGGVWRTTGGQAVSQGGNIATSLRTTTRRIYDEMMTADPDQFWDRFDSVSHHADVDLGADGFYARWRGAMRQGLYLLDDWPEARVARQMPGVKLPDGSIDWQAVGQLAQSGDKNAQRAMGGKRAHDLFVHRIAGSADPDGEVYNVLVNFHLDQHSGRFTGNQYGAQYWTQRAEQISEVLRDAGYAPSPQLIQRLASINVGDLVATELAGRTGTAAMRGQSLAANGVITLHVPGRNRPIAFSLGRQVQAPQLADPVIAQNLRKQLDDYGLTDVGLRIVDRISEVIHGAPESARGVYQPYERLITLAMHEADDLPLSAAERMGTVLDHEVVHALRAADLFTSEEWETLVYAARTNGVGDMVSRDYAAFEAWDAEQAQEELVAHLYEAWRINELTLDRDVTTLLQKVLDFFRGLGWALKETYPEDILRDIESGVIGGRPRPGSVSRSNAFSLDNAPTVRRFPEPKGTYDAEPFARAFAEGEGESLRGVFDEVHPYYDALDEMLDALTDDQRMAQRQWRSQIQAKQVGQDVAPLPVFRVPLNPAEATLAASQDSIYGPNIDFLRAHPESITRDNMPVVYKQGDFYLVSDGHHRVAAARLNGEESVPAFVFDLDTGTPLGSSPRPGTQFRLNGVSSLTRSQQIMNAPSPPQPGINVMPNPNQQRISTSFGYLSATNRQRIVDHLPDDAIMGPDAIPVSLQAQLRLQETMPNGFKFNDGTTSAGTVKDAIDATAQELDQWVEMANDPALQAGPAAQEFARLSKKFAIDGDVLDSLELAGPQNAWRRDAVVENIMRAAAENAFPKAAKSQVPGLEIYQSFLDMRRRVQLYNYLNIPRFAVQQHVGNSISTAIAGKPKVALSIFTNLRDYRAVNRKLNNPGKYTLFNDDLQRKIGGGTRLNVTQSNRASLALDGAGNVEAAMGPFGHMAKLLAPKGTVNVGKINDTIARFEIDESETLRGFRTMNKDLARETYKWSQQYGLPYTDTQINDSIQRFLNQNRVVIDANTGRPHTTMLGRTAKFEATYSANDLRDWLRTDLPVLARPTSATSSDPLELLVRRVGADASNNIKAIQAASDAEINRVAFEWMPNNLDEVAQNFTMYHYWMTRAGGLYVQQMLKNPWAMAAYGRMMEDFEGQIEMLDGPDWMRGWFQFMNTPAGFTVWYSPTDLFSTLLTFADWQMEAGESPFDDLTWLGKARNHIPFLLNPALDFIAYAIGAYGPDAQVPDLLGLNRPATMATDLLNLANAQGLLPGWVRAAGIGVDAQGNPVPLQPKKLTELYANVGNGISSALKGVTGLRPVPIPNTAASQQRSIAYILEQNFRADYPGLPQEDVDRKVTDALADPGSAEYQRAWRMQVDMPYMTGDTPLPGWAEGAIRTVLSPIQMYAGTEQQFMDSTMKGYEPTGEIPGRNFPTFTMPDGSIMTVDDLKQMTDEEQFNLSATVPGVSEWMDEVKFANNAAKYGASKTVEGRVLAEQYDAYFDAGDPTINAVKSVSNGIYFGNASEPVSVGGVTYSPEEIAGFDEDTRKALANQYRDENGVTWDMIEQNDAARDAYLDANPNVAAYLDWKNAAYDHPGGEVGYIQEQMATNPAYADYMSRNNFDLQTGAVDYDHALSSDAFLAAQGIAPTLYEPISSPTMEPLPAPQKQTVTSTVALDVYPGPDSTLAPFAQADTGFPMTLVEMDGNWAKITIGGQEGYVDAGYLQNAPGGYAPEGLTGAIGGVVNGGGQGIASLIDGAGSVVGTMFGGGGLSIKPSNEPGFATGQYGVMPAPDGMGIRSTPESDRSWMEDMIGGGHAIVTTDYKGTPPVGVSYEYQTGHGADGTTHAAYDISCDTGYNADGSSSCPGTPIMAPISGSVVCAGYGQGTGGAMGSPACTYSQNTTINNPDGSPPAHTIVLDVGTDAAGNDLQLSFNHMGTSDLTPGQGIEPGDLLGGMGDTEGGPHVHLEAWGWCPSAGTYIIVDPALVVDGYFSQNAVC